MRQTTPVADIHVSLLGGFLLSIDGRSVDDHWRLRKAKTLVKLLALAPGHRMHRDVVVEMLWPEAEPEAAINNLHQLIHNIRRMLGPASIALGDDVVRLCPAGGLTVDVDLFEKAAAEARGSGDIAALNHALHLWTGPLLPEDDYAGWALEHRERLTETHAAVATLLGSKLAEQDKPEAALAILEPLASARPLDENLHRILIDALARLGRRWEAIEAYERLRDRLEDAYAAEPEPRPKPSTADSSPETDPRLPVSRRVPSSGRPRHRITDWPRAGMGTTELILAARKCW